jgi:transposase
MTRLPPGVKVHLAFGYIDMRKGIDRLAMLVQGFLRQDPFSGHLFVFRGRKAPTAALCSIEIATSSSHKLAQRCHMAPHF